jgi:hypothetical protein
MVCKGSGQIPRPRANAVEVLFLTGTHDLSRLDGLRLFGLSSRSHSGKP